MSKHDCQFMHLFSMPRSYFVHSCLILITEDSYICGADFLFRSDTYQRAANYLFIYLFTVFIFTLKRSSVEDGHCCNCRMELIRFLARYNSTHSWNTPSELCFKTQISARLDCVENLTRQRHDRDQTENQPTVAAFCWFSVWSLSCRCRVTGFLRSPALQKFESFIFLAD